MSDPLESRLPIFYLTESLEQLFAANGIPPLAIGISPYGEVSTDRLRLR
jgi:hypothetical protein